MRYVWLCGHSIIFVALAGFLWMGACQAQTRVLRFNMLEGGFFAGTGGQGYRCEILRERHRFEDFYREIHGNRLPAPPIPEVDFQRYAVLFFSLDARPTAGYSVDVEKVVQNGNRLDVQLKITEPPQDSIQAQVITRPFVMVTVEQFSGVQKVRFLGFGFTPLCESVW